MDKEEQLKDLECSNDPNKEDEINKLRSELDTLKEICCKKAKFIYDC